MKTDYEKAFRGATPETLARALMQPAKAIRATDSKPAQKQRERKPDTRCRKGR